MSRPKARSTAAKIASELTVTVMQQHPTHMRTSSDVGEFYRAVYAVVMDCLAPEGEEDEDDD